MCYPRPHVKETAFANPFQSRPFSIQQVKGLRTHSLTQQKGRTPLCPCLLRLYICGRFHSRCTSWGRRAVNLINCTFTAPIWDQVENELLVFIVIVGTHLRLGSLAALSRPHYFKINRPFVQLHARTYAFVCKSQIYPLGRIIPQ